MHRGRQTEQRGAAEAVVIVAVAALFVAAVSFASAILTRSERSSLSFPDVSDSSVLAVGRSADTCGAARPGDAPAATVLSLSAGSRAVLSRAVSERAWNADFDGDGRADTTRINDINLSAAGLEPRLVGKGSVLRVNTTAGCWHFTPPPEPDLPG